MYAWSLVVKLIIFHVFFVGTICAAERNIGILTKTNRGEREAAKRMELAAIRLGWKVTTYSPDQEGEIDNSHDFVITLMRGIPNHCSIPNYLAIMDPAGWFDRKGNLGAMYQEFDGFLVTLTNTRFVEFFNPRMYWIPTVHKVPYCEHAPTLMAHLICNWGERANSQRYIEFYHMLDAFDDVVFYGSPKGRELCPRHFRGSIPFDGTSVVDKIQDAGIVLIFHSKFHLSEGIPSGRIFESAAASAIIISDLNPFVIEQFGDSVLYVDQNQTSEKMVAQIRQHLDWIHSHPQEAKQLAKRAHQIFSTHYTLEEQLLRLEDFHSTCLEIGRE